jgi:uncharacterized protein (DUF3084 family)
MATLREFLTLVAGTVVSASTIAAYTKLSKAACETWR